MTMIVEDGTIVAGANSYASIAQGDAYFGARNFTDWETFTDETKEAALIYATDYMRQKYKLRYRGSLVEAFQPQDWPRNGVPVVDYLDPYYQSVRLIGTGLENVVYYPTNVVPEQVVAACLMLAKSTISGTGNSATAQNPLQGTVGRLTKFEKVGTLEVEYLSFGQGGDRVTNWYWDADQTLQPLLNPTAGSGVVRS